MTSAGTRELAGWDGWLAQLLGVESSAIRLKLRAALAHQSNRLYDLWQGTEHLILKEYLRPAEFSTGPKFEFQALTHTRPLDIAPEPVYWTEQHDAHRRPVVIYRYMDGKMWDRTKPGPTELSKLLAMYLSLHDMQWPEMWLSRGITQAKQLREIIVPRAKSTLTLYQHWVTDHFPAGQRAVDLMVTQWVSIEQACDDLVNMPEAALKFCRSDPRFANIIQRPDGRLGMVDWEDSGLRDPAMEAADMVSHPNQEDLLGWDEWDSFLNPYLDTFARTDFGLLQRFEHYLMVFYSFYLERLIAAGLQHWRQGSLGAWRANAMDPNQRLRRYLARALAWPKRDYQQVLAGLGDLVFFPEAYQ